MWDSLILSGFNHCFQVYGFHLTQFWQLKLQRIQNSCLRFIFCIRKRQRISHTLKVVNWLNMKNRLHFFTVTLIHKVLSDKKTSYLHRKIQFRTDVHNINIRRKNLICCPKHRLHLFERSFTYLAYKLYNVVPYEFKHLQASAFKRRLKEWLMDTQA